LRRTRLRIPDQSEEIKYKIGKYIFDYKNLLLSTHDKEYRLTKREAEVLNLLSMNVNNVSRREMILKTVWGENDYFMGRSMDVYISKLRKYLKEDASLMMIFPVIKKL
jgi:DNA-binding response OmpR family regulator